MIKKLISLEKENETLKSTAFVWQASKNIRYERQVMQDIIMHVSFLEKVLLPFCLQEVRVIGAHELL